MQNQSNRSSVVFEALQGRRMMAITTGLAGGVLTVNGTAQADNISIKIFPQTPDKLSVTVDERRFVEYDLADVTGVVINGFDGNDWLDINEHDVACGLPATINGGAGRDMMFGGSGNDWLSGGAGKDYVNGAAGNDTVMGGGSKDLLYGGAGNDLILAGNGLDRVFAGAGNDTVNGGLSDDQILGSGGNDVLFGAAGRDDVQGDDGADTIIGGRGDDQLNGGSGFDVLQGGAGADSFAIDATNPHEQADKNSNDEAFTPSPNDDFVELITTALSQQFPNTNIESVDLDKVNEVVRIRYTYTTPDKPGLYNMLILNPGNNFENPDLIWYEIHPLAADPRFTAAFPTLLPGATALIITKCDMFMNGIRSGRGYKVTYQMPDTGETGVLLAYEDGGEAPSGTTTAV